MLQNFMSFMNDIADNSPQKTGGNWTTPALILTDWLEDHQDFTFKKASACTLSFCLRWMVKRGKFPFNKAVVPNVTSLTYPWIWLDEDMGAIWVRPSKWEKIARNLHCGVLPSLVYDRLRRGGVHSRTLGHRDFESSITALAISLQKIRDIVL